MSEGGVVASFVVPFIRTRCLHRHEPRLAALECYDSAAQTIR